MIEVTEVGRRLRILVGGEEEIFVPPISSAAGATLLVTFVEALNIGADLFEGDLNTKVEDLAQLGLGKPLMKDPENPTNLELKKQAEFEELWEQVNEFRSEEVQAIVEAAMFWNVMGGSLKLAKEAGIDRPKAILALFSETGLQVFPTGTTPDGAAGPSIPPAAFTSITTSHVSTATPSSPPVDPHRTPASEIPATFVRPEAAE
jgi:hypothetical protein